MSHELRTPLNSLLILSKLLGDNVARNLTPKQLEYAQTIHDSGSDLLSLINDILDMAKIESGTMAVDLEAVPLAQVRRELEHTFLQVAQQKELGFTVTIDPGVPQAIHTDAKRLQQVLNNLVSNACKFTEQGWVEVRIAPAPAGWSTDHATLSQVTEVIAFAVTRHRDRHRAREVAARLRALPAGGHGYRPEVWRDGAGAVHQPRDRPSPGRRNRPREHPGPGEYVHPLLAVELAVSPPWPDGDARSRGQRPGGLGPGDAGGTGPEQTEGRRALGWEGRPARTRSGENHGLQEDQVRHVLVVEDNDIERLGITALIGDGTVKTTAVATGAEALAILRAEHVDVLVLDLRLPDISGFDVLREVAGQPDDRNLEVVIYTGIEPDAGASGDVAAVEGDGDPQDPDFSHRTARHGQSLPEAGAASSRGRPLSPSPRPARPIRRPWPSPAGRS